MVYFLTRELNTNSHHNVPSTHCGIGVIYWNMTCRGLSPRVRGRIDSLGVLINNRATVEIPGQ